MRNESTPQAAPTVNPAEATPKQRFQMQPGWVGIHRDLIASPAFERAVDAALLEYGMLLADRSTDNPNNAAAAHFKMAGALEFIGVMKKLSEKLYAPARTKDENLDHTV